MTLLESRPGDGRADAQQSTGAETLLPPVDTSPAALAAVTAKLAETAAEYDRTGDFPWAGIQVVHDAGLLRLGIGEVYGGRNVSSSEFARVFQALGEGDPSVALLTAMTVFQHVFQAQSTAATGGVEADRGLWPAGVYERLVAESLERPSLVNAIRAEPELGAPARGGLPATRVERTDTGWLLNGHKGFGTGSEGLVYHAVWAATDDEDPLIGHVIVPAGTPGIEIVKTWDHLGLRATSTHDIIYTNVEVPFENFRGVPLSKAPNEKGGSGGIGLSISALYLGVARAAQKFFTTFTNERVPSSLGRPIATTERIQSIAGEIEAQLVQAEEVLYGLASRIDQGDQDALQRSLLAKLIITRSSITAVQTAVGALGNPGLTRNNPLERHLRDVLCSRVHPPQDDAALLIAGKRVLASYVSPVV
ncbi:acyl-CoA dehydrogenase family protein [Subtercola endophyticus]|uniref:acyl-CoA dehydrogenase family protein n=1 Tax=Subtercola endophyticus TaxID=2895559 RepID=UPI001E542CC6|nr:acyl-CoA dehydrogenase family protein [Subtercola endophyticus]UFS58282.1 acyl-CoA/acyl-ACP dehydrogenase [Subtercola endophyticus]